MVQELYAPCAVPVKVGQKWREIDYRQDRVVEVLELGTKQVATSEWVRDGAIQHRKLVNKEVPAVLIRREGGKPTWAQLSRFTGKSGGYNLEHDV